MTRHHPPRALLDVPTDADADAIIAASTGRTGWALARHIIYTEIRRADALIFAVIASVAFTALGIALLLGARP